MVYDAVFQPVAELPAELLQKCGKAAVCDGGRMCGFAIVSHNQDEYVYIDYSWERVREDKITDPMLWTSIEKANRYLEKIKTHRNPWKRKPDAIVVFWMHPEIDWEKGVYEGLRSHFPGCPRS